MKTYKSIKIDGEVYLKKRQPNVFIKFKTGKLPGSQPVLSYFQSQFLQLFPKKSSFAKNIWVTKKMSLVWNNIKDESRRQELLQEFPNLQNSITKIEKELESVQKAKASNS